MSGTEAHLKRFQILEQTLVVVQKDFFALIWKMPGFTLALFRFRPVKNFRKKRA